jgi:tetratricopeptide (TPR) repeat protein
MHSKLTPFICAIVCVHLALSGASAQEEARKLFEAGKYQEVVEKTAADPSPDAVYLKGLAHRKLGQGDQAKEAFQRLQGGGEAWKATGEAAVALGDGNMDAALAQADAAIKANPGLWQAQFQRGLVLEARSENGPAADAFAKAAEMSPQTAYAHYHAGMNFYKAKRVDKMAVYFENFLKLAPNAPERPAVESIMRTVRGR